VFVWNDGVLLVDDKLAPASPAVKKAVAASTRTPIHFIVNSHWHRDHSGGNALAKPASRNRRVPMSLSRSARR
jgi:glyoxylase-like metal-dependent hydrolase (beta-lactamase superfamily II)